MKYYKGTIIPTISSVLNVKERIVEKSGSIMHVADYRNIDSALSEYRKYILNLKLSGFRVFKMKQKQLGLYDCFFFKEKKLIKSGGGVTLQNFTHITGLPTAVLFVEAFKDSERKIDVTKLINICEEEV